MNTIDVALKVKKERTYYYDKNEKSKLFCKGDIIFKAL